VRGVRDPSDPCTGRPCLNNGTLPLLVRVFVTPVPVLLLFCVLRLLPVVNLDVLLIEELVIAPILVLVPLVVVLMAFVVITFIVVVVGHDQRGS
jgi:hypothetical protein